MHKAPTVLFAILAGVAMLALMAYSSGISQGYGKVLTATTNATTVAVMDNGVAGTATRCSVAVTGSNTVYFMKNVGSGSYNSFLLTNAIPVPSGGEYEFMPGDDISNLGYATKTNSSDFVVAFE